MKKRNLCSRVSALAALMLFCNLSVALAQTTITERVVVDKGEKKSLSEGATYTCPALSGDFGGAVSVEEGGTLTGTDVTFSQNRALIGGAIDNNKGTIVFEGIATFENNKSTSENTPLGGAIYNLGEITFKKSVTFSCDTASNNAFGLGGAINNAGVITFEDNVVFDGNKADDGDKGAGGAIYNNSSSGNCIINLGGIVTLGTSSDIWVNEGFVKPVVVNWDLTKAVPDESGTCSSVGIVNFERYENVDNVQQKITVKAEQPNGDYVIASGDLTDVKNKDSFIITGVDGRKDMTIKINDQSVIYGLQEYSLKSDGKRLVLTIDDASYDVTVGPDGYATFYTDVNLKVPEETRVFSYTYESSIKTLIGTEVEPGSILPANQGYVLKGEAKTYKLKMTNKEASPIESVLSGTTEGGQTVSGQIYVLGTLKEVTTFYKYNGTTFPAGKAYFEFPNSETIAVEDNPGWIWIKD